jgi:hypothetical protein
MQIPVVGLYYLYDSPGYLLGQDPTLRPELGVKESLIFRVTRK